MASLSGVEGEHWVEIIRKGMSMLLFLVLYTVRFQELYCVQVLSLLWVDSLCRTSFPPLYESLLTRSDPLLEGYHPGGREEEE